jgi:hypothetical protein
MRRIGVLMSRSADNPDVLALVSAFAQGLQERGWTVGGNVRIEYRWGAGDLDRFRRYAAELVALSPDVVLAAAGSIVGAFQQASRTIRLRSRRTNRARRERKRHRIPNSFIQQEFGLDPLGGSRIRNFANLSAAR